MEYIQANKDEEPQGCVFCALLDAGAPDDGRRILGRGDHAFVTLAKYPYNPGHLLILPVRHVGELEELTAEENAELAVLLQRGPRAERAASEPHGFNVGLNLGRTAGAGIPEHLHWHVVPRWSGDTNFMPVLADVKLISENMKKTWKQLCKAVKSEA